MDRRITSAVLITLLESFNNCTPLFKLLFFIEYEEKKQKEHSYRSLTFSRRATTKCTTKPVGDNLAIVFEAMEFKEAFCSLFNSKSPNFSEVKTFVYASSKVRSVNTEEYTLPIPQD